jgi:hypothetical protein
MSAISLTELSHESRSEGDEGTRRKTASAYPGCAGESATGLPLDFRGIVDRVAGTAGEESEGTGAKS